MEHKRRRMTHAWLLGGGSSMGEDDMYSNKSFEENIALLAVENRWPQLKSHLPETSTHNVAEAERWQDG